MDLAINKIDSIPEQRIDFDYLAGNELIAATCPYCGDKAVIQVTPFCFGKCVVSACRHYLESNWSSQTMTFTE